MNAFEDSAPPRHAEQRHHMEWQATAESPKSPKWLTSAREYGVDYIIVCMPTPVSLIDSSFHAALPSSKAHLRSHRVCLCVCVHIICVFLTTLFGWNFSVCLLSFDLPTLLCLFCAPLCQRRLVSWDCLLPLEAHFCRCVSRQLISRQAALQ